MCVCVYYYSNYTGAEPKNGNKFNFITRKFVSDHSGVGWGEEFSKVIQTRDIVEGLHNQGSAIWRLNGKK